MLRSLRPLNQLFRRESAEQKAVTLTDPAAWELFGVTTTTAGPAIGPSSAMKVPAVACAVTLLSTACGTLPAKLYTASPKGKRTATKHPSYALAHDWANDWTAAGELRQQLTRDALLNDKGGFAYVNRVDGRPVELLRLDPASVQMMQDDATGEPVYLVGEHGKQRRYGWRDVLHLQAPGGTSPISRAREAIALALVLEQHAARLFGNGARPNALLYNDSKFGEAGATVIKNIRAAWRATFGAGQSDAPLILDSGWKYQQLALTSTDAQFEELRRFQIEEIARAFNVPPTMLFELTRGTWSNVEQLALQFLTFSLRPWLEAWQAAYVRVLIAPEDRAGYFIEFVTDDLLTADFAARATAYAQYRAMGAMTANEVRAGLNLPPHKDGDTLDNPNITPAKSTTVSHSAANDNADRREDAA